MKYLCKPVLDIDSFREDQELRHVQMDDHQLQTWDTYKVDRQGNSRLAYRLTHHPAEGEVRVVFEGDDFFASPMSSIDSDNALRSILTFLTLQVGDTDARYFEKYTTEQLEWVSAEAEDLNWWAMEEQGDFRPPPFIDLDNFDGEDDDE